MLGATEISIGASGIVSTAGFPGFSPNANSASGGGSGGTLLLEASQVDVAAGGFVTASGGQGGTGDPFRLKVPGGAGGGVNPPGDGATMSGSFYTGGSGTIDGGGGGAAGFIRVRALACATAWPGYAPVPTCEAL